MATREFATGAGLQITFEGDGLGGIPEGDCGLNTPGVKLQRVRAGSGIVLTQAILQIVRDPSVMKRGVLFADQDVDVLEGWHAKPESRSAEQPRPPAYARRGSHDSGGAAFALRCAASAGWWAIQDLNL